MLDIKLIRENPEKVRANLEKRGDSALLKQLEDLIRTDEKWRLLLTQVNELRHKRRLVTEEIAKLKKQGKNLEEKVDEAKIIPDQISNLEKMAEAQKEKANTLLYRLPNLLH